jgi:hypothetical protein
LQKADWRACPRGKLKELGFANWMVASMEWLSGKLKDLCLANQTGLSEGLEDGCFNIMSPREKLKGLGWNHIRLVGRLVQGGSQRDSAWLGKLDGCFNEMSEREAEGSLLGKSDRLIRGFRGWLP